MAVLRRVKISHHTQSNTCKSLSVLHWLHDERDGVSNHHRSDCLLNRLLRRRLKKTSKLRITGLCAGNSPVTGEFPAQRASNAENVSISWRHHDDTVTSHSQGPTHWYKIIVHGPVLSPCGARRVLIDASRPYGPHTGLEIVNSPCGYRKWA